MNAYEFLKKHRQTADDIDSAAAMRQFWQEMDLGLAGSGGLPMIPTYLVNVTRGNVKPYSKRILIDAGGTNFRSAIGYFDENGKVVTEHLSKTVMPGSDRELSAAEFYGEIARNIAPLLSAADNIGFCFSYQVRMGADADGEVVMFSKEVKAPEVVGTRVGKQTLIACRAYDDKPRRIVILNDTVATLLGGMAITDKEYSAYLGYIYGTGTNVCYVEDTSAITKVNDLPQGTMPVNTECGNFDGFEQGTFDRKAIARTALPDKQLFEKMSAGKYLADIMYEALCAAKDEGLLSAEIVPFTLRDVSAFLDGKDFPCKLSRYEDVLFARDLLSQMIRRAAKMGATVNAALAIRSCKDKSKPVAIVAEGTTFNKLSGYRAYFTDYLGDILAPYGVRFDIVQGEELNLVGTLLATSVLDRGDM